MTTIGAATNPANGSIQYKTLSANTTFTESLESGQSITLMVNGGATPYPVTWPTITWVGGSAPTIPANKYAVMQIWKVGSTLYGSYSGDA